MAERKLAAQEKREAALAKRQQQIDEKNGIKTEPAKTEEAKKSAADPVKTEEKAKSNTQDSIQQQNVEDKQAARKAAADAKAKTLEERKKAIADKKAKILEDREAAKKAKEENNKKPEKGTTEEDK